MGQRLRCLILNSAAYRALHSSHFSTIVSMLRSVLIVRSHVFLCCALFLAEIGFEMGQWNTAYLLDRGLVPGAVQAPWASSPIASSHDERAAESAVPVPLDNDSIAEAAPSATPNGDREAADEAELRATSWLNGARDRLLSVWRTFNVVCTCKPWKQAARPAVRSSFVTMPHFISLLEAL